MTESLVPFRDKIFVLKIGGELVAPGKLEGVAEGIRAFLAAGIRVVMVHGGGPQASALTERLGLSPRKEGGRRVTDAATLQVVKQALAGEVSVDLAALLRKEGIPLLALHGVSAALIDAVKRPPMVVAGGPKEPVDFGFVGDVSSVNTELLQLLCKNGYVPALASLAGDAAGGVWNINADTVATQLAVALGAAKLLLVSGVPGVMRDIRDPQSRIPSIDPKEAERLIAAGVITDGMIAKVEEALEGIRAGIAAVHLCGAGPGELLEEVQAPGSAGTVFVA